MFVNQPHKKVSYRFSFKGASAGYLLNRSKCWIGVLMCTLSQYPSIINDPTTKVGVKK